MQSDVRVRSYAHAAMCVTACRISGPFYNCYDRRGRTTFQRRPDLNATSRTNPDNSPAWRTFHIFSLRHSSPPLSLWSNIYSIKSHRSSVTFFNFISSSCFPFFSLLSFPHFLYIFHGALTTENRQRTTARSGICPEYQQLRLSHGKKKEAFYLASSAESIAGVAERGTEIGFPRREIYWTSLFPHPPATLGKLVSVFINVAMCLPGGGILSRNV